MCMKCGNLGRTLDVKNDAKLTILVAINGYIKQKMIVDYLSAAVFCFADMLDKNHLASTVCTILDWYIVNIAGM